MTTMIQDKVPVLLNQALLLCLKKDLQDADIFIWELLIMYQMQIVKMKP